MPDSLRIKYSLPGITALRMGAAPFGIDSAGHVVLAFPNRAIRFGRYTVDPDRHVIDDGGRELHLEPRGFALLTYLIERRDRVVTKAELLDALWPSIHVSESVVARCVMKVRLVLGDPGRRSSMIRTVHRIGYRFTGDTIESGPR